MNNSNAISAGGAGASGFGKMWGNWNSSVAAEEGLLQRAQGSEFNADQVKKRTAYEAWRNDVYARRVEGQQRQALAVAGVDLSGTAIDDLVATMSELTLDKVMGIYNGQSQENALRAEAKDARRAQKRMANNRKLTLGFDWVGMGAQIAAAVAGI